HILVTQKAAFNSPVWFNVGWRPQPQVSACFILSVEDEMSSILNWYVEEGLIFKHGSGSGLNLSKIRSSRELLRSGGTASGPVSFMRGADASAGTIKSGGATRRAAKMVVLNVDHPDIKDFIWCKAHEEVKARALREAGFDMDLDGKDSHSIQYQNANNSVRVTDEFMNAVIEDKDWNLVGVTTGQTIETLPAKDLFREIAQAAWDCADPGIQYDTTINDWHTCSNTSRINASNPCSEYMHVDNSSCNLASLNLMKFLDDEDRFDVDAYKHAVEVMFLAQEISVGFASYPTEKIGENSRTFRQLGQGYANLGAMLMAQGLAYDSDEGRAWAAAITSIMTGHCYVTSAKIAKRVGAFEAYAANREPMLRVINKHREASYKIPDGHVPQTIVDAARTSWDEAVALGQKHGYRNAQATVLAPTGCLVGGSLVPTERGLVRLGSLGDVDGQQWQNLGIEVNTDEGARTATQFYLNGLEAVVTATTERGYRIQGTPKHRIKVVDERGQWMWKRFAELDSGDVVPLALNQLIGEPQNVELPPLSQAYWTGEHSAVAPRLMKPDLAEFLGYFMGDGSLHSRGIRMCVAAGDFDVVERLRLLGKELFNLEAHTAEKTGYTEVAFHSVRLVQWWEACGFAKYSPREGHSGKGYHPHIPGAVLYSNDREAYAGFIRGLFEADGTVTGGYPNWSTANLEFSHDVQSLLLALGYPTTRKFDTSGWGSELAVLRLLNTGYNERWLNDIGFMSDRKNAAIEIKNSAQSARKDKIPFTRELIDRLAPSNDRMRKVLLLEFARTRSVSRRLATELHELTGDRELGRLLRFYYDPIASAELGEEQLTYDLSVPDNVTYIANGFVSHNTIGLLMDCDTTGIEPDLALKKMKKLVGGGTMSIVNQTVPRGLRKLGYSDEQVAEIVAFIDDNGHVIDAPHMREEHMDVFDTAMGERSISYMGHIRMMAAAQPFLSGAISKTVNLPEDVTVEDVEQAYIEGWRGGLKALAIYRDNCKVAQPLSGSKKEKAKAAEVAGVTALPEPVRRRLPKKRMSRTIKFRVADTEGYITTGEFPDGLMGELFLKVAKQGSTLAGIMDAFAISISMGLQYGVPLSAYVKQFVNTRFEPSGMTDDPDFRIATSILDYVFRVLAVEYLTDAERHSLGIRTSGERQSEIEAKLDPNVTGDKPNGDGNGNGHATKPEKDEGVIVLGNVASASLGSHPFCGTCGVQMQPAGSCFACPSCGSTSGCS
ncbi:MAG: adenosylcobalamin-dependent ribonucleoside-diphosphate reductase, partial [Actinomycetota bacterium]|nr:adenosylcobalamin-dependent ribonucleoside-diphosphate reductase [Actinomycetota bacterium]